MAVTPTAPHQMDLSVLPLLLLWLGGGAGECVPCEQAECPVLYEECVSGVVLDTCGCCQVCARSEAELCDQNAICLFHPLNNT